MGVWLYNHWVAVIFMTLETTAQTELEKSANTCVREKKTVICWETLHENCLTLSSAYVLEPLNLSRGNIYLSQQDFKKFPYDVILTSIQRRSVAQYSLIWILEFKVKLNFFVPSIGFDRSKSYTWSCRKSARETFQSAGTEERKHSRSRWWGAYWWRNRFFFVWELSWTC